MFLNCKHKFLSDQVWCIVSGKSCFVQIARILPRRNVVDIGNGRRNWARDGNPYVIFTSDKDLHHIRGPGPSQLLYFMVQSSRISRLTVLRACMLYRRRLLRENKFHRGILVSPFSVQRTVEQDMRRVSSMRFIYLVHFLVSEDGKLFYPEKKITSENTEKIRALKRPHAIVSSDCANLRIGFTRCFTIFRAPWKE